MFTKPLYPLLVGLLLGVLQTGLFFQLTFTLSSTVGTFLLVTVCWLLGSAVGVYALARSQLSTGLFLILALAAYGLCVVFLLLAPFDTTLWPLYAGLVTLSGLYPGVFFGRLSRVYPARTLFLWENNGFMLGLLVATVGFLLAGRIVVWALPPLLVALLLWMGEPRAPQSA